jgi:hypothetical protein
MGLGSDRPTSKPLYTESFQPCRLFFPILRSRIRLKRVQEVRRYAGDGADCRKKCLFVRLGWLIEAADLSNVLERSGMNFIRGDGRIEVEEHLDVPTHFRGTSIKPKSGLIPLVR